MSLQLTRPVPKTFGAVVRPRGLFRGASVPVDSGRGQRGARKAGRLRAISKDVSSVGATGHWGVPAERPALRWKAPKCPPSPPSLWEQNRGLRAEG